MRLIKIRSAVKDRDIVWNHVMKYLIGKGDKWRYATKSSHGS